MAHSLDASSDAVAAPSLDVITAFPELDVTERLQKKSQFPMGSGGFADVWEGSLDGEKVAIKVMRCALSAASQEERVRKRTFKELKAWSKASHKNILPLLGFASGIGPFVSLVSPWQENGDACQFLKDKSQAKALDIILGAAEGLQYLHSHGIIHGDFRGNNILISAEEVAIVADFGLARVLDATATTTSTSAGGNVAWMSPELFEPFSQATVESDIWAFGMTCLELLSKKRPYHECFSTPSIMMAVTRGMTPTDEESIPQYIRENVCHGCWKYSASQRTPMVELIQSLSGFTNAQTIGTAPKGPDLDLAGRVQGTESTPPVYEDGLQTVWKGTFDGQTVAVKKIYYISPNLATKSIREMKRLASLSHANVLPLLGYIKEVGILAFVYPWQENGNARSFLREKDLPTILRVLIDAGTGLVYLHENGVVHADMRGRNILVAGDGRAVISDAGLHSIIAEASSTITTSIAASGNVAWLAPELLHPPHSPSQASDIWAFGMTILELISGTNPYAKRFSPYGGMKAILKGVLPDRPDLFPTDIWYDVCQRCWAKVDYERPRAAEVLQDLVAFSEEYA